MSQHSSNHQNDMPLDSHIPSICVLKMELETLISLWSCFDGRLSLNMFMLCIGVAYLPCGLRETNEFELRQFGRCNFHGDDGHLS